MAGDFDETEFGSRRSVPARSSKSSSSSKPPKPSKSGKPSKPSKSSKSSRKREDSRSADSGRRKSKKGGKRSKGGKSSRLQRSRVPEKSSSKPGESLTQEKETSGVLVPLDQWTRVLNQLGNLHEAGQQIADARERAVKAETEAAFLRERLKELRAELEVHKRIPQDRG